MIENWHDQTPEGTNRETTLTGEDVASDGQAITYQRKGQETRVISDPQALEELRREAGDGPINVGINGANHVFWSDKVADGAKQLVQRLELHRSDSLIGTFLHKSAEADIRRARSWA